MARMYKKPPLIEAICDLKFSSTQPWDWTIPGLFYEKIQRSFPVKEQLATIETQIDPQQGKFVQKSLPKLQFVSENRTEAIQIAPNLLSIHQLPVYDGWVSFKKRVIEYLQIYRNTSNSDSLTHIGLRYVNHIEIPSENFELEDYFCVLPHIPQPIPQEFSSFLINVDVPYTSISCILRVTFGTVVPKTENHLAYVLDLNMFSVKEKPFSDYEIIDWLEDAHEKIVKAFDTSFTEKAHIDIFKEIKNE